MVLHPMVLWMKIKMHQRVLHQSVLCIKSKPPDGGAPDGAVYESEIHPMVVHPMVLYMKVKSTRWWCTRWCCIWKCLSSDWWCVWWRCIYCSYSCSLCDIEFQMSYRFLPRWGFTDCSSSLLLADFCASLFLCFIISLRWVYVKVDDRL